MRKLHETFLNPAKSFLTNSDRKITRPGSAQWQPGGRKKHKTGKNVNRRNSRVKIRVLEPFKINLFLL
jgi:hypothetical protein